MSNADRIEELRAKYEENPRRYFAPLANEYRKAGDLAQAITICREHLPKQPGHMSGFIVYGQTLFEANKLDDARSVFEQALALDPENLIALKHLGDIARMNGENGVARRWYARVLDADPRNDDIASQLASLGAPTPITPMPSIPEPLAAGDSAGGAAVGVFATFDPGSLLDVPEDVVGIAGSREFWAPAPPETRAVPQHEPLDLDFPENPEPVSEGDFEEGLMAPEWPDTSELVARVITPFHSATPISVPATPDTVAAFGREAYDQVEPSPVEQPPADELVAAFLPPEPAARVDTGDEPVELGDHDFAAAEFETESLLVDDDIAGAAGLDDTVVAESEIITGDVVMPTDITPEPTQSFLDELASFESPLDTDGDFTFASSVDAGNESAVEPSPLEASMEVGTEAEPALTAFVFDDAHDAAFADDVVDVVDVDDVVDEDDAGGADPRAGELAGDTASAATPDEDIVWADTVMTNAATTNSVETHSDADEMVSAEGSSEEPIAELAEFASGDTQEFEIPEPLISGAHAAFADVAEASTEHTAVNETIGTETGIPEESFAEVASQLESEKAPFVTETMAELLVAQGFLPRAIEVYDELVSRRPHDPVLVARLHELRALHEADEFSSSDTPAIEPVAASRTPSFNAQLRDTPLENTPVRNTPLYMTPQYGTPQYGTPQYGTPQYGTPQYGMPADGTPQHDTLQYGTPQDGAPTHATPAYNEALSATPALVPAVEEADTGSNVSERRTHERLQAFRTARDRFAELSRRRVARRTPPHATAVPDDAVDGLASLFGTAVPTTTDELAARALADAFGPVQDSGESLFDPAPSPTPAMPMRASTRCCTRGSRRATRWRPCSTASSAASARFWGNTCSRSRSRSGRSSAGR